MRLDVSTIGSAVSRLLLATVVSVVVAPGAFAADGVPPAAPAPAPLPPSTPPPAPIDFTVAESQERARRAIDEAPDVVVKDVPLRLDGPIDDVQRLSPLGFGAGPVVPLNATGAKDVLSPQRVRELTPTSVAEVANWLPGVGSRLYSGDEYMRPSIGMRGMPDNGFTEYEAVLVDGFNMSTLAYGWTAISIFPFSAERIWAAEVYRGAHALRYGPNTIGGVINFVTPPIPKEPTFRERLIWGTYNYHATVTDVGGTDPSGRFGALVTFVEKGGDTFRKDNEFGSNELALKTRWNIDCDSWLGLNAGHWRAVYQLPGRLTKAQLDDDPSQNPNPREVDWHGWSYFGTLTYHRDYGCDSWLEAFAYHRLAERALDSGRPTNGPPFTAIRSADSDNWNSGIEFRGEFPIYLGTTHRLHWGARYHREEIERTTFDDPIVPGPRVVTQDADTINHAVALNLDDTMTFGRLTLNVGARFEWVVDSYAYDKVTNAVKTFDFADVFPGASAAYELTPCWALFANAHSSFRAPQTFSYDFTQPTQKLDYERGANYEIGTRWKELRGFSGSVTAWQVDFSDFIELDPLTNVVTNHGAFRSRGVDLVVDAQLGAWARGLCGWSLFGNVTRQESELREGVNEGNDTPFVPAWLAAGGVRYEHRSGAYGLVDAAFRDRSAVLDDNSIHTPDYTLFGARAGWRHTRDVGCATIEFDVAVGVKNLFDADYYLRHNATLYVPGTPREMFIDVSVGIEF